jgi:hypothetical protein
MIVVALLAVFGLTFLIKQSDGPWGIINWFRNKLISNQFAGVFFYKLLDCWFCTGCHAGWIVYLLYLTHQFFIIWVLAGGAICIILGAVHEFLYRE